MSKLSAIGFVFFALQVFFVIWGIEYLGVEKNPYGLFISFVGLSVCYFIAIIKRNDTFNAIAKHNNKLRMVAVGTIIAVIAITIPILIQLFIRYPEAEIIKYTDVLPLIIRQYDYFVTGQSPYQPMKLVVHTAYPAYMPLHWLPIGLGRVLDIDPRWGGIILLAISITIFVGFTIQHMGSKLFNAGVLLLPLILYCILIKYTEKDIAITFETVIAAYYLLLATALLQRKLSFVVVGIVLCLMSRYTLVFWLPFFFLLLLLQSGWRITGRSVLFIIVAIWCIFILPFLWHNPTLLKDSLHYHNEAAIGDWKGNKYSFIWGVFFGPQFDAWVSGTAEHKVFVARIIQLSTMCLLSVFGLLYYYKNKNNINIYDLSLGILYLVVFCFYMIGPFAFRYYMMGPLFMSLVLWVRIARTQQFTS